MVARAAAPAARDNRFSRPREQRMAVFVLCRSGSARADFALVSTSGLPNVSSLANRHSAAWVLPTGCFGDDSPEAGPLEARSHMESFLERAQYSPTSDQLTITDENTRKKASETRDDC
ncbi:hypothetical protein ACO22_06616 [Paracoccidioides brasiliensis]|uniref:Uncharacterized protein n=1 Tax=Paracoccidioides brasiliensis TaxID=121759 RepID=A0A1D2J6Y2_PARBR|nr:hypothetical protein ACO22_06616 [Paracoccidioides brasiliensis]